MAEVNKLPITQSGQWKNISLADMENEDSIVVEKKFAECKRVEKPSKFNPEQMWTSVSTAVVYNGEDVGFFFNGTNTGEKYIDSTEYADKFDACGGEGDKVKITCKKWFGKNNVAKGPKKGTDLVAREYIIEKVE